MTTYTTTHNEQFTALNVAVLIPTYNNSKTIAAVLKDVLSYTTHVIVVNDGSTDNTSEILDGFPQIQRLEYEKNRGKGIALRRGFKFAVRQGYDYVITIDSDGQHYASDLPVFLNKLETEKRAIIIGARNLHQENMPGKSTSANKVSNFWFHVTTGLKGPDTQSGYRLYPVYLLRKMFFLCTKYEFEIEVLVRSSWRGIKVDWAPIGVYYPPPEERVSHFRPVWDVTRITLLNIVLVLTAFLYIKPRDFVRALFKKKTWVSIWNDHFLNKNESNLRKASSIGFGVFMGIVPIWGFQLVTAIALATLFRLNKPLVLLAAHVSFPPLIPFFIYASFVVGRLVVPSNAKAVEFSNSLSLDNLKQVMGQNALQYFTGGITLAIAAGLFAFLTTLLLLTIFRPQVAAVKAEAL
jgi:glycosyltransferase involved in cell wall biosynthesis